MEKVGKTKTTVMGSGTSPNTKTEVVIENAAGVHLVKVSINDDGTGLLVTTKDGQRITKE